MTEYLISFYNPNIFDQIIISCVAGIIISSVVYTALKINYSGANNKKIDINHLFGKDGLVTIETTKNNLIQIKLIINNNDFFFLAQESNNKVLHKNDIVRIIGTIGSILIVSKQ